MDVAGWIERGEDASLAETIGAMLVTSVVFTLGIVVASSQVTVLTVIGSFVFYALATLFMALLFTKVTWLLNDRCMYYNSLKIYTACSVVFTPSFLIYSLLTMSDSIWLLTVFALLFLMCGVVMAGAIAVRFTVDLFDVDIVTAVVLHLIVDGGLLVALNIMNVGAVLNGPSQMPAQGMPMQAR